MGIDLDLMLAREPAQTTCEVIRDLTEDDLSLLGGRKENYLQPIQKLKERHHALARALAVGMPAKEAAVSVGYTPQNCVILMKDPTFRQLVEDYRGLEDSQFQDFAGAMLSLSKSAVGELHRRVEEEPKLMATKDVIHIAEFGTNRTGFPAATTSTNIQVNVNLADRLQAARRRIIEHKKEEPDGGGGDSITVKEI